MGANPYMQYQKVQVETADQGRLLLMLYEGLCVFEACPEIFTRQEYGRSTQQPLRVEDIVFELMASLIWKKERGCIGSFRLYDYITPSAREANLKRIPAA